MARRTFDLLRGQEGRKTSVNGATQIRAGVMRPEIVIPALGHQVLTATGENEGMTIGSPIRVIRMPYFGQLGTVAALPPNSRSWRPRRRCAS